MSTARKTHNKKLEIKHYWSPDIENLWAWQPEDNAVFYLLQMDIGFVGEEATDNYCIVVATPEGIAASFENNNKKVCAASHKKMILQKEYSWEKIVAYIKQLLAGIDTCNQYEARDCLRDYFYWEYASPPDALIR